METNTIPYEQWAKNYLSHDTAKIQIHRSETPHEVEMIETYIEEN